MHRHIFTRVLSVLFISTLSASAHLSYPTARDFGLFTGVEARSLTIAGQTTKAFSWADGTDADFGRQDDQRYFQFTLQNTAAVTITITAVDAATLLPAFSIYAGLGHGVTDPSNPDYDGAAVTQAYLATLGEPQPREGAFDALHTFKIGNDSDPDTGYIADLVTFIYMGHAADGTALNFGGAPGINGDGLADGFVSATFLLGPGAYTMAVGGADYGSTDAVARGFTATVSSVPEPTSAALLTGGFAVLGARRYRRPGSVACRDLRGSLFSAADDGGLLVHRDNG